MTEPGPGKGKKTFLGTGCQGGRRRVRGGVDQKGIEKAMIASRWGTKVLSHAARKKQKTQLSRGGAPKEEKQREEEQKKRSRSKYGNKKKRSTTLDKQRRL